MSAVVKAWCECSWHGEFRSEAQAAYARRRHSCDRWLGKRATARHRVELERAVDRTPKVCGHKVANHEHGTYPMYTLDFCRCAPCARAASEYEKRRKRDRAYGRVAYVDARPAVEHLRALMAAGLGWKRVARMAGLEGSVVYPLLYGRHYQNGGQPRTKVRPATAAALLAVPFPTLHDLAPGARIDSTGTRRRVQALIACGWSVQQLAAHADLADRQAIDHALYRPQIEAGTAQAVARTYDALWNVAPPEGDRWARTAASRSRHRAAAEGWALPAAWDDDSIDDPEAEPVVVKAEQTTPAERLDEWVHLVRAGEEPTRAARRVGWKSTNTVEVNAYRLDRRDVLDLLWPDRQAVAS